MNTRHIALLGLTVSGFLATALAGCSANNPPATKKKTDAGATTAAGAGGNTGTTTSGAAGDTTAAGVGGMLMPMTGAGGTAGTIDFSACMKPMPAAKALVVSDTLTDLEGDAPGAIMNVTPGGGWYSYKDPEVGPTFTPDPASWMVEPGGVAPSVNAVHVVGAGFMGPPSATNWGAGTGFSLGGATPGGPVAGGTATTPTDLGTYTGISFMAKSSMMSDISVQFATPDTDPSYCDCNVKGSCYSTHFFLVPTVAAAWTMYTVKFADLHQPMYGTPVAFDPTNVLTINFASNGPLAAFDYWLDDIKLTK